MDLPISSKVNGVKGLPFSRLKRLKTNIFLNYIFVNNTGNKKDFLLYAKNDMVDNNAQ